MAHTISTLPPPNIVTSEIIQTHIKADGSGGFTVDVTVRLSVEQPQGSKEFDFSEVWIGDRNLMEYEELESGISGVVFQFQVSGFVHSMQSECLHLSAPAKWKYCLHS